MRRHTLIALLLLLLLSLIACDRGQEQIQPSELQSLVLQPQDLGAGWIDIGSGAPGGRVDQFPGVGSSLRMDHRGAWVARYRWVGGGRRPPALVVESRVDLFQDSAAAEQRLDAAERELRSTDIPATPDLGEETAMGSVTQESLSGLVRFYTVIWRHRNLMASVVVQGFDRTLRLADAVKLARKQERRIDRALDADAG